MTEVHRIHSEPKSKNDTILPPSLWRKFTGSIQDIFPGMIQSLDLFWAKVHGWYNPTTFSMTEVHRIRSKPNFKDDTILPPSRWPKFTGSVLNRSPRMIQSCHLLDDRSSPDPFWTKIQGWYNPTTFLMTEVTLDTFWTEGQGWYNPTTFLMTEVTGSLLDICPGMIQSLFILQDRGL